MKVTVVVATHKPYAMPADSLYLPLHVGAEGKEPFGFGQKWIYIEKVC